MAHSLECVSVWIQSLECVHYTQALTAQVHESRAGKVDEDKPRQVILDWLELMVDVGCEGAVAVGVRGPRPSSRAVGGDRPEKPGKTRMDESLVCACGSHMIEVQLTQSLHSLHSYNLQTALCTLTHYLLGVQSAKCKDCVLLPHTPNPLPPTRALQSLSL